MNGAGRVGATVVSASMAIVATQAMAYVAQNSQVPLLLEQGHEVDAELKERIEVAVGKRDVRLAVSEAFSVLASKFGDESGSLTAKYFPKDELPRFAQTQDFTLDGGSCYSNCYSNCHNACHSACHSACHYACHGSRGWR